MYPGQIKTCNKCQELSSNCPGKGLARDCTADKILLSDYMTSYWKKIDFKPETTEMNENVDDFEEGNSQKSSLYQWLHDFHLQTAPKVT